MKIKIILISLLFVPSFALAQNEATLPNAGLTPESNFYFLDKLNEALREFLTFNPEGKARLQITFAAERVAEIKAILESKGVEAKGLEVAQSRLQTHLANAATIVSDRKAEGKDVSQLAKELDDDFEIPKTALEETFKAEKRALEAKEKELKEKILEARRTGDAAQVESLVQQLGQVKAQKELLELKEEEVEEALEREEERLEEGMELKEEAAEAIKEAREEIAEAERVLSRAFSMNPGGDFFAAETKIADAKGKISEAEALLTGEDFAAVIDIAEDAEQLAEDALDAIEDILEDETEEEESERLENERERASEEAKEAEEKLRDAGNEDED